MFGDVTSLGVLQGSGTAAAPGDGEAILGARVEGDGSTASFQTVVNSFSLSQIREPGDAIDIVESVMDHFGVDGGQYAVESEDPIVYHWQPRQTVANIDLPVKAIVLGGTDGQPVTLFYRHHSIGDYVVARHGALGRAAVATCASSRRPTSPPTGSTTSSGPVRRRRSSPPPRRAATWPTRSRCSCPTWPPRPAPEPEPEPAPSPGPDADRRRRRPPAGDSRRPVARR